MKYENLEKAKKKCDDIDEVKYVLEVLRDSRTRVKIVSYIGKSWEYSPEAFKSDYPEMPLEEVKNFIEKIILHYSLLYSKLIKELEEL